MFGFEIGSGLCMNSSWGVGFLGSCHVCTILISDVLVHVILIIDAYTHVRYMVHVILISYVFLMYMHHV